MHLRLSLCLGLLVGFAPAIARPHGLQGSRPDGLHLSPLSSLSPATGSEPSMKAAGIVGDGQIHHLPSSDVVQTGLHSKIKRDPASRASAPTPSEGDEADAISRLEAAVARQKDRIDRMKISDNLYQNVVPDEAINMGVAHQMIRDRAAFGKASNEEVPPLVKEVKGLLRNVNTASKEGKKLAQRYRGALTAAKQLRPSKLPPPNAAEIHFRAKIGPLDV